MRLFNFINPSLFNKIIIVFWAIWWSIALWTDVVGGLAHLNLLHATWAPDANFPFLASSLKMYHVPVWFVVILFLGIILWSFLSAVTFLWAAFSLHKDREIWLQRAQLAFIISLSFWLAFFLADQMVMKFDLEENHMVQGGFALLTYLLFHIDYSQEKMMKAVK